jgi:hypothetical protein
MVEIGDRVIVESEKVSVEPRTGVVAAVHGPIVHIRWDGGGESSFVPAAGSMRVIGPGEVGPAR